MVHFNIYISNQEWDFQYGGAYLCAENQSSSLFYELWYDCPQPMRGQYITVQNGVFMDRETNPEESLVELAICEIQIYAKGMNQTD